MRKVGNRMQPPMGGMPKKKMNIQTIKRLLSYLQEYRFQLIVVIICIILASVTGVISSLFLQVLIDDYISPLLLEAVPDFSGLLRIIIIMAGIYLVGVLAAFIYTRLMAIISQGVLKRVRDEMFAHMQKLPIKYFDQHPHGDLMSHYTNDTDTLRQILSQSIPHTFS